MIPSDNGGYFPPQNYPGYVSNELGSLTGNPVWNVVIADVDYHANIGDMVMVDCSTGPVTVYLPTPRSGYMIGVKKIDHTSNMVTVTSSSAVVESGISNIMMTTPMSSRDFVGSKTGWFCK